jgi:shikimate dehydrogenase
MSEFPSSFGGEAGARVVRTGLIGCGILASRSPWLHEREAEAQGIRLNYALFDFSDRGWADAYLPVVLADCQNNGFAGINITFPFKQAVIAHLDDLSDAARRVGAVNTVQFTGGKRIGHNTDVSGFAESLRSGLPNAKFDVVIQIGCGGAGSATAHALLECGTGRLFLFDWDQRKREILAANLRQSFNADRIITDADLGESVQTADGIVNATPMGMAAYPSSPLSAALLDPRHWVADIVYFPLETQLLRDARAKGCGTLDGSGMAVHQAAEAFEIFTGLSPDRERMLQSFVEFVSGPAIRAA